jgi:hypothetical protein
MEKANKKAWQAKHHDILERTKASDRRDDSPTCLCIKGNDQ